MRIILILAALFISASAWAQAPEGYEEFYSAPTGANLGGRPVVADIALYADMAAAANGDLRIALVTDVTKFIEETERDLENWVAARQDRCGERWGAGEPLIDFPPDAIRFALDLELELWNCGWNGKGEPGRLAREAGRIDVTLDAYVQEGKLQTRLISFAIDERAGVSKYLPLEFFAKRIIDGELKKLNQNRKFYRAPQPLFDEGFVYESIKGDEADGRVWITARYRAGGAPEDLERLAERMTSEGITQPKEE